MLKSRLAFAGSAAAAALLCIGSVPASAGLIGGMINKSINGHGNGPVWFERQDAFKGLNQVVIGQFSVVFLTKKVDFSGGGFLSANAKGKAIGQLSGVSREEYMRITDAVFEDFKTKLAASGITLVDPAAYYASKYYQKVRSEEQGHSVTIPLQDQDTADGIAFWPSSMAHRDNMALTLRFMDGNQRDLYTAQYDYARTAKVPVLNVVYVVDFAEPAKSEGGGVFQSIKATAQLAISQRGSLAFLMDTSGKPAKINVNQPIVESGDFAQIKDTTSGLTKTAEATHSIMNIGGALLGKGGNAFGKSSMSRRFEFAVTDPANYAALVTHAGGQANDLLIGQLGMSR